MPINNVIRPKCFEKQLHGITKKKFSKSTDSINKTINDVLHHNPFPPGDLIPGFHPLLLYKWRLPLKEYNIGDRGGLSVIYLLLEQLDQLVFIAMYYKGEHKSEPEKMAMIKRNLKSILSDVSPT
jgi:hypothetical protein